MKILVAGSRTFTDRTLLELELGKYLHRDPIIVSGGARGADTLAEAYAGAAGLQFVKYAADWQQYGKAAGMIRNRQMIEIERPTLVMVFYGPEGQSKGSAYTESLARERLIPVEVFYQDSGI